MAGYNYPTNVDSTYADSGTDPTVQLHQQYHDGIHTIINKFDKDATPTVGQTLVWNGTVYVPQNLTVNAQVGTTYTLALADAWAQVTLNNAGAITLTIPLNVFAVNTMISGLQLGAGQVTIAVAGGVTCVARGITPPIKAAGQYAPFFLQQYANNAWVASGDISA